MIDVRYYRNVAELMGINKPLPKPRLKCTLHDSRAETLNELKIIKITAMDGDYYEDDRRISR